MKRVLLLMLWTLCIAPANAAEQSRLEDCARIEDDTARLSCYDGLARSPQGDEAIRFTSIASPNRPLVEERTTPQQRQFAALNPWSLSLLTSDDPNYFGVSWEPGNTNRGVETHLEFDISLKYPLLSFSERSRLYMIYNGSYDFQALTAGDTYESSPVISKTQNPGAVVEWDIGDGRRKFRSGIFHHSNGQTLGESDDPLRRAEAIARIRDREQRFGEAPAWERISRSSWYAQLRYQWMSNPQGRITNDWSQLQLELRPYYFLNEDRIFWTDPASHSPQIENVDGIRAVAEKMIPLNTILPLQKIIPSLPVNGLARLELQTGLWSPFENIGGKISLGLSFDKLLISGYYYSGFAKDIAAYHKRTRHMGIGIELR